MTPPRLPKPTRQRLLRLLALPGPSCQEGRVAEFVRRSLLDAGADPRWIHTDQAHRRTPQPGEVGNLSCKLPGRRGRGPRRLLVAHMDTVPICVGTRPEIQGRYVRSANPKTGLGADDRAGVAVLLETALRLLREQPEHPPVTFLWTVQEELGLQGARLASLAPLGKPFAAFNWDGGAATKLTIGATGGYRMRIDVQGKAAHAGGAPQDGVSAITVASLAIASLHRNGWLGLIRGPKGEGTSNVGVVRGGSATNVVADQVELLAEARSHRRTFRERIVAAYRKAFADAARQVRSAQGETARVNIDGRLDYEAFCLPSTAPAVQTACHAITLLGETPELAIANGGLDANWLTARGIPTVTLGCGQRRQHTVDETLDLDEFTRALQIAWILATEPLP